MSSQDPAQGQHPDLRHAVAGLKLRLAADPTISWRGQGWLLRVGLSLWLDRGRSMVSTDREWLHRVVSGPSPL